MSQLSLLDGVTIVPWKPRQLGEVAAEACAVKAEKTAAFDREGAGKFIVGWLVRHGATSGEALTDAAKQHGYRPHDDRAFGSIFQSLARRNQIRTVGFGLRAKGHGTGGLRIWAAVWKEAA